MLFYHFLKKFVKVGQLQWTDSNGVTTTFGADSSLSIAIRTHTKKIERRMLYSPTLAVGEGYMDGDLTLEKGDIYDFLTFCAINQTQESFSALKRLIFKITPFLQFLERHNSLSLSRKNVSHHYDIRKEIYDLFLDDDFQYSCAYFEHPEDSLEMAQENKKRHIAAKLRIRPGDKILDIGCGWGGLALYLAKETGAHVTGLTLSKEQHKVATERAKEAGLSDQVKFLLQDYREEKEMYDRIVSVGMFEHVGLKSYPEFFNKVDSLLKKDGIALLHSIGYPVPNITNVWLKKYIFPGGYCPSLSETISALEPTNLLVSDVEILHLHYAETLCNWRERFMKNREKAKELMGERFCRMWEFYLAGCEVVFRQKNFMVFQIQMIKDVNTSVLTRNYINEWEQQHPLKTQELKVVKKKA